MKHDRLDRLLWGIWNAFVGIGVFALTVAAAVMWGYLG